MESKIILFDSNTIIDWFNGNKEIETIVTNPNNLCFISCITKAELQQGASNKLHLRKINQSIDKFPLIEIEIKSSQLFNQLFETFYLSHQCSIPDMFIAATALYYDIELFTFNTKDFNYIPKLRLLKHNIKPLKKDGWFL